MRTGYVAVIAFVLGSTLPLALQLQLPMTHQPAATHVTLNDVTWWASPQYPESLRRVYRYKALIGGSRPGVIPQDDVLMGVLELAPGAIYAAHAHPAPEIYYVMHGEVRWTVGSENFSASPGMAIYHPSNTLHRMVNVGDDVARVVYLWWAPGGNSSILRVGSRLLEPAAEQPARAKFPDQDPKR
jgi:quercetin dioxygenase-like cupin family protein